MDFGSEMPYLLRKSGMWYAHNNCGYTARAELAEIYSMKKAFRYAAASDGEVRAVALSEVIASAAQLDPYLERMQTMREALMRPRRIQRRRTKGWRMPENTVYVGRGSKWGNPYKIGETVHCGPSFSGRDFIVKDNAQAVRLYRDWLFTQRQASELIFPLKGKNLACWCALDKPCHADVLLEMANTQEPTQ